MILTEAKDWSEIQEAMKLWELQKVVVIGCGSCSAQCGTGGTEGVKKIVDHLKKDNIEVLASIIIQEPCDKRLVRKDIRYIQKEVDEADGLLVASCGSGAQTVQEITGKITLVTTDTIFIAQTERIGKYSNKCQACGKCSLNETGGICPISACAKSLLNGPCGGPIDGKCEVGGYVNSCGWVDIYNRLKDLDKLEMFYKYRPPRNWGLVVKNKNKDVRKEMKTYYDN